MDKKTYHDFRSLARDVRKDIPAPPGILPENERFTAHDPISGSGGNLSKRQIEYLSLLEKAKKFLPNVTVMAWTGPADNPLNWLDHLCPASQVRVSFLLPVPRCEEDRRSIPMSLKNAEEYQLPANKFHWSQVSCLGDDWDLGFRASSELTGPIRDASMYPYTDRSKWRVGHFGYSEHSGSGNLISPISGLVTVKADDLHLKVRVGGKVAFRFDLSSFGDGEKLELVSDQTHVKAGQPLGKLLGQISYLEALFSDEGQHYRAQRHPLSFTADPDDDNGRYELGIAMAQMRVWEALGPHSISDPELLFPRRMIEIPDLSLLDNWSVANLGDHARKILVGDCGAEGLDIESLDSEELKIICLHLYGVKSGERRYRGKGILLDWHFADEELRAASIRDWLDFEHIRGSLVRDIGGYAMAVRNDVRPTSMHGIQYSYTVKQKKPQVSDGKQPKKPLPQHKSGRKFARLS